MKNNKILFVIIICIFSITFNIYAENNSKYNSKTLVTFLPMGTGATSGTYYPLGSAFANVMTSKLNDVNVLSLSTSGSLENIRLLRKRELKIAIAQSDTFYYAVKGIKRFKDEDHTDLRALLSLYPEVVQVIVPAKSEITSITQLAGKKVILGPKGSGNVSTALNVLSVYGLNEKNIIPGYLSFDKAIGAIENGNYDAFFLLAGLPTKAILELEKRTDVRILNIEEGMRQDICSQMSFMSCVTIPENTYKNQKKAINTVALKALLITTKDLPDEIGYSIVKTIFNNLDYLKTMHQRASDISVESYLDAIPDKFLHRGSEKYYKEKKAFKK